jgi:hypothetical protein
VHKVDGTLVYYTYALGNSGAPEVLVKTEEIPARRKLDPERMEHNDLAARSSQGRFWKGPWVRLLALHGWAQNEETFRVKTKKLAKKLAGVGIELVYASAPLVLPCLSNNVAAPLGAINERGRKNARAWWYYDNNNRNNLDERSWRPQE